VGAVCESCRQVAHELDENVDRMKAAREYQPSNRRRRDLHAVEIHDQNQLARSAGVRGQLFVDLNDDTPGQDRTVGLPSKSGSTLSDRFAPTSVLGLLPSAM